MDDDPLVPPAPVDAVYRVMLSEALTLLHVAETRQRALQRHLAELKVELRRYTAAQVEP